MLTIETVTGPVAAHRLGSVLPHEQVFHLSEDFRINFLPDWDEEAQVAAAAARLRELKELGMDTLFDVSVFGVGRRVDRVRRVAEASGVNIVVATGIYTYDELPFQFHYNGLGLGSDTPDPLEELLIRDLTVGIAATGIKAAFLVCVIEAEGLTDGVERVMRAVGRASVATGAPVVVHTNPHTRSGLVAQRVLASEGVDLRRVMLAHCGDTTDLDYLRHLADSGSILSMDRFGVEVLLPHADRMNTLTALLENGLADQLVISHGAFCYSDWFDPQRLAAQLPDWNFRQIPLRVLPELRERGVPESDLTTMLVDVPRRFLTGEQGRPGLVRQISEKTGLSPDKCE